ncbi:hypothetical protein GR160_09515 [Flavobacterium sp. Sd200]|uniref:SMI1/KNR4 family protein n=1 Tax=Flavobacterium sp. Sd200 TaxID=2692211 RepID=UPI00136F40D9|nr:SMI1/KNR4 family protein [Flavobacterium sp. Sd200]MXN91466.1 hypothetical protein [Flavobacterium sp. Sd200]
MKIIKKGTLFIDSIRNFTESIDFKLPLDFLEFYKETNSAEIYTDSGSYIVLWKLDDLLELNTQYKVNEYAPEYFIFGSDGGNEAYCIQKLTGNIYQMPFIGMSNEDVLFICETLLELFN